MTSRFLTFYRESIFPLLLLAAPLMVTGIIESSISFFSTFFLAKLGPKELAAGALVGWVFATLMVIMWGSLTAVSVVVAQKHGEKNQLAIAQTLKDGLFLVALLVIPSSLIIWNMAPILILFGQSPALAALGESYFHALTWGILPDFTTLVLLQFLIGLGHTRTSMMFIMFWVPVAILANYLLIFGLYGVPKLGIAGIGWGMSISYWLTVCILIGFLWIRSQYRKYLQMAFSCQSFQYIKDLLQIGLPMGGMYCVEVGFFLALSLLMGMQSEVQLAANQIALQYLSIVIAIVFSTAQAVTVRMSHLLGAKQGEEADRTSLAGILISVMFMFLVAFVYWFFPNAVIGFDLDLNDPNNTQLIIYAKQLLGLCAIFQLLEAVRISLFGSLRALKDTHFTFLTSIISLWVIALPLGYLLASVGFSGAGLWYGLIVGAFCSIILLRWRYNNKIKKSIDILSH